MLNIVIKIRLYPTIKQKTMLDGHFDTYRYCYNLCLEYKSQMWQWYKITKSGIDMQAELFEIMKSIPWISKCKVECIREAAHNVDKAYKNFFKGKGFPNFKNKKGVQSFTAYQNIKSINSKIKFFGNYIKYRTDEGYTQLLECNRIKQVTFKKDAAGDYFACCLIEIPDPEKLPVTDKTIGLDLGIQDLVVTSDGITYANNKYLVSAQYQLKKLQRKHSKTKKGGKNREKLRIKMTKLYRKTVRQKEHYYHQVANNLIRDNQTIVMETLVVKNMIKNPKMARNISDVSWGLFTRLLEYKCKNAGRNLVKVSQWYPSSKTCSRCGTVKEELSLKERIYNCDHCDLSLNRDINAAINIRNTGLKIPGVPVEVRGYATSEAGSNQLI